MTQFQLDSSDSLIEFTIRHLLIAKVRGRFTNFAGLIDVDPDDITRSKVNVEIGVASISTDDARRDDYLRSADVFDVATYPLISFASERIELDGEKFRVIGALTMHGVTREVVLRVEPLGPVSDPLGTGRIAFAGNTTIGRKDFGLHWNALLEAGVGDEVEISFDIRAHRVVAQAAA